MNLLDVTLSFDMKCVKQRRMGCRIHTTSLKRERDIQ